MRLDDLPQQVPVAYAVAATWHQAAGAVASIVTEMSKPYLVSWCRVHFTSRADGDFRNERGDH
jgi:hypothetical protein